MYCAQGRSGGRVYASSRESPRGCKLARIAARLQIGAARDN